MANVPTNKLGTATQLRDSDITLIKKIYGYGKFFNRSFYIMETLYYVNVP